MTVPVLGDVATRVADLVPVLRRHAAIADVTARFPVESLHALRERRMLGLMVPTRYGGYGADMKTFVTTAAKLATGCLSTAQIWAMHCFQVDAVSRHGSPELCGSLLTRVADEQVYIASVTSERGPGGSSLFTASAPLVTEGDQVTVARSAPVVTGAAHADGYLIKMRSGMETTEHDVAWVYADRADLTRAELTGSWDTLGMRATESLGMEIAGCVPTRNVLGSGVCGRPDVARESMIPVSHLGWSACWLGAARGALSELVHSYRRAGTAGQSDLFAERLAQVRLNLELVSAYLGRVREMVERVRAAGGSLATPRAQLHINALKLAASELTFGAVDRMIQLAGLRLGYARGAPIPLERHFRDLRAASLNHSNDSLLVGVGTLTLADQAVNLI